MSYLHGGDVYRTKNIEYDFSININPLGMPVRSLEAAREAVLLSGRYPDYKGGQLCRAIAEAEKADESWILLGNGAAELIYILCHTLRPAQGMITAPSFQEYEAAILSAGGSPVIWNLEEEDHFQIRDDCLSAITEGVDVFFLCNPNNPTGSLTERKLLEKIAAKCESTDTFFCLDECFLPFLENEENITMKHQVRKYPHLIILRAFTKIYGMPGLRLGYALSANEELLSRMRMCLQPWNTSIPAQMAGIEALKDRQYLEESRQLIRREKDYLTGEMRKGLAEKIYDSSANYLFFKSRSDLKELLLQHKILIRGCGNFRGLTDEHFRIGIRTHEENQELIRRWREIRWQNQS